MARILHIHASPRLESYSLQMAQAFLETYQKVHPQTGVERLDLFDTDLPEFDAPAARAKYSVMGGAEPQDEAGQVWRRVIEIIDHFKSADMYVISSPMWNFSIPYRLKQYIDILVQPGLTFSSSAEGYKGLVDGRKAALLLARGGAYPPGSGEKFDMQTPYLKQVLGFIGIADVKSVALDGTLADPAGLKENAAKAIEQSRQLAREF